MRPSLHLSLGFCLAATLMAFIFMPATLPTRDPLTRRRRRTLLLGVCLAGLLVGAAYGIWSWHQFTRPGQSFYRRGMDALAAKRFQEAEQQWQNGVRADPTFPDCYERLGDLYQQIRDYPQAVVNYEQAAKLRPQDGSLLKRLAVAQLETGDDRAAFVTAKRAYELLPEDAQVAGNYGDLAQRRGHREDAIAALRKAHQLDPTNNRYLLSLVNVEMDLDLMPAAEQDLTPYAQAHPDDAWASYLMAVLYNEKPRTPENLRQAISYATRSASINNAPRPAFTLLAQLYLNSGQFADAERACQAGMQRNPNDTELMAQFVRCESLLGRSQVAAKTASELHMLQTRHDRIDYLGRHLKMLTVFHSSDVPLGLELAKLEEEDGKLKEARTYYVTLVHLAPNDPRTRTALAGFLRREGRPDLAQQALNPKFVP